MAYHDKYKKVLDEIWKDKVELDGMIVKEEEKAIKKVKGEALKEKDDLGAFLFPIRLEGQVNENALADTGSDINTMPYQIYEQLGREEMKKVDRGITMINHTQVEAMGILTNVLCQVGVTTLIDKFLILDIPIDCDAPIVVGRGFLRTIGGIVNTLKRLFSTFDGFCHQTFRAAISDVMRNAESDSNDEEEYEIKRNKFGAPIYGPKPAPYLNVFLPQVHHEFLLWGGCNNEAKSRYNTKLANLLPRHIYSPCVVNWDVPDGMGCDGEIDDMLRIKLREAESNEKIFTFVTWIRAFNIKEPIYVELCHEFYSTYEFDKVCADDELQTKKIIKFRLGVHAHNLTLLEFARRLGLYHADELEEDRFDGIFREACVLLSMFDARHQNGYENVAWLIARWMKRKGAGNQKESQICYGQFITKIARKARVLTNVVLRSLSAPIYCRDLDTTTLRELIDYEGRLILEDPQPGVPRVGIPRPPRASMQDLYQGVFEHMAGVYSVPLQGAYNPPGYAQPQYDQYYQQYPPPPPQYQQQQQDDDE
ncbi:retrotransposon ORF1 [Tanacetum coccineum]